MAGEKPNTPMITGVKSIPTEHQPSVYANHAEINVSNWDFRLKFGEIETISEGNVIVEERVRVVMSPQHTKVFLKVLQDNLAKWEARFGEIDLSKMTPVKAAAKGKTVATE